MAIQTKMGKAFEYACLNALNEKISKNKQVDLIKDKAYMTSQKSYKNTDENMQQTMDIASNAAVKAILKLEPQLENNDMDSPLYLQIQKDAKGILGDVRDIVCIRKQNEWEIGISCKHNHTAVKHSRLSLNIDFGDKWFGLPCSKQYFKDIEPMFTELSRLKSNGTLWRDINDKDKKYYVPLLNAFMSELKRLDSNNKGIVPERLLRYLLGSKDFYKVITNDAEKTTQIQAYNIYGTLNRQAGKAKATTKVPILAMPKKFYDIDFKPNSSNTIIVACSEGWTVSMRIHNARTIVEPSLKFDVKLIGVPQNLHSHFQAWE